MIFGRFARESFTVGVVGRTRSTVRLSSNALDGNGLREEVWFYSGNLYEHQGR
jgi:hypothetical protein